MTWKHFAVVVIICFAVVTWPVLGQTNIRRFTVSTNPETVAVDSSWYAAGGYIEWRVKGGVGVGDITITLESTILKMDSELRPMATYSTTENSKIGILSVTPYPDKFVLHIDAPISGDEVVIVLEDIPLDAYYARSILEPGAPAIASVIISGSVRGWSFDQTAVQVMRLIKAPAARR